MALPKRVTPLLLLMICPLSNAGSTVKKEKPPDYARECPGEFAVIEKDLRHQPGLHLSGWKQPDLDDNTASRYCKTQELCHQWGTVEVWRASDDNLQGASTSFPPQQEDGWDLLAWGLNDGLWKEQSHLPKLLNGLSTNPAAGLIVGRSPIDSRDKLDNYLKALVQEGQLKAEDHPRILHTADAAIKYEPWLKKKGHIGRSVIPRSRWERRVYAVLAAAAWSVPARCAYLCDQHNLNKEGPPCTAYEYGGDFFWPTVDRADWEKEKINLNKVGMDWNWMARHKGRAILEEWGFSEYLNPTRIEEDDPFLRGCGLNPLQTLGYAKHWLENYDLCAMRDRRT